MHNKEYLIGDMRCAASRHSTMEFLDLIPHIESLIFASDKPLTTEEISELVNNAFGFMEDKVEPGQVETALSAITEKYASEHYPFSVLQSGGGWQFLTKKEYHKTVAQLNGEKFLKRLSAAALETLAIIAYKQPITKGEIEIIRGVSSDYTVQKLLEKELIVITGRNEQMPGHPLVYATSKSFMDYFGINTADDLPRIKEVLADQVIEPTVVEPIDLEQSDSLLVTDNGELMEADAIQNDDLSGTGEIVTDNSTDQGTGEEPTTPINAAETNPAPIEPDSTQEEAGTPPPGSHDGEEGQPGNTEEA